MIIKINEYSDVPIYLQIRNQIVMGISSGELAAGEQPFNLTLLTVDTHFEDGYKCRLCDDRFGDNQYANAIACSMVGLEVASPAIRSKMRH